MTAPVTVTTTEGFTDTVEAVLSAKVLSTQTGVAWKVDGVTLTVADQPIATEPYGANVHNVIVEIADTVPASTSIINTITFTATSQ